MRERICGDLARLCVLRGIEGKQKQRTRIRCRVPRSNGVRGRTIANQHRMHGRTEKSLDKQRGILIRADEIAQWAKHRAFAELVALAKQSSSSRSEPDSLALERVERIDFALKGSVRFVGAKQLGARRR